MVRLLNALRSRQPKLADRIAAVHCKRIAEHRNSPCDRCEEKRSHPQQIVNTEVFPGGISAKSVSAAGYANSVEES